MRVLARRSEFYEELSLAPHAIERSVAQPLRDSEVDKNLRDYLLC